MITGGTTPDDSRRRCRFAILTGPISSFPRGGKNDADRGHYRHGEQTGVIRAKRAVLRESDLELARRAAGGDRSAFHAVVDRHAQALYRLARGLSSSRPDAEDLVQETFVEAIKSIGGFDGRSSLMTWLTRILFRRAGRLWKRNRRARAMISLDAAGDSARPHDRLVSMPATSSVDHRLDLAAVLPRLAPEHRQVLLLREMQGMSYAEIARTLKVPQGTVESRLHRARKELREKMSE